MNLIKSFSFKYLIQNIKKSKAEILIYLLLVPAFTTLMILKANFAVYDFWILGLPNIIGMYILPVLLSIALFGYVYHKSSVDFIGSMPLSRKTIFFTNTIGGIGLIIISQLLTLMLTLICSVFVPSIIFVSTVFDIFLYQTLAYIYVFTISNLAMSVSGNVRTQIVMVLLFVFLLPVTHIYIELMTCYEANIPYLTYVPFLDNLTAPVQVINDGCYRFNTISLIKMVVLSIIYIAIGYVVFKNRKLEKAGESFIYEKNHLLIKSLTLVPFVLVISLFSITSSEAVILLAITLVYWIAYDLVTGKKVKLIKNIICFVITFIVLTFGYKSAYKLKCRYVESKAQNIDCIQLVFSRYDTGKKSETVYSITDYDVINNILNKKSKNEVVTNDINNKDNVLSAKTTLFSGKTEFTGYFIFSEEYVKSIEKYKVDNNTNYPSKNTKLSYDRTILDKEDANKILEITHTLNPYYMEDQVDLYHVTDFEDYVSVYDYENHYLKEYYYYTNSSSELNDLIDEVMRKTIYNRLSKNDTDVYIEDVRTNTNEYLLSFYWNDSSNFKEELVKFILNDYKNKFDNTIEYAKIRVRISNDYFSTYMYYKTNDISKVTEILEKNDALYDSLEEDIDIYYDKYYNIDGVKTEVVETEMTSTY